MTLKRFTAGYRAILIVLIAAAVQMPATVEAAGPTIWVPRNANRPASFSFERRPGDGVCDLAVKEW